MDDDDFDEWQEAEIVPQEKQVIVENNTEHNSLQHKNEPLITNKVIQKQQQTSLQITQNTKIPYSTSLHEQNKVEEKQKIERMDSNQIQIVQQGNKQNNIQYVLNENENFNDILAFPEQKNKKQQSMNKQLQQSDQFYSNIDEIDKPNINIEEVSKSETIDHKQGKVQQNMRQKQEKLEQNIEKQDNPKIKVQTTNTGNNEEDEWQWQDTNQQDKIQNMNNIQISHQIDNKSGTQSNQHNFSNIFTNQNQIENLNAININKCQEIQPQSYKQIQNQNFGSHVIVNNQLHAQMQHSDTVMSSQGKEAVVCTQKIQQNDEQFGEYEEEVKENKVEQVVSELSKSVYDTANQFLSRIPDYSYIRVSYFQEC